MAPSPTVAPVSKMLSFSRLILFSVLIVVLRYSSSTKAQDVVGCGGFVQSDVDINYSLIQVRTGMPADDRCNIHFNFSFISRMLVRVSDFVIFLWYSECNSKCLKIEKESLHFESVFSTYNSL